MSFSIVFQRAIMLGDPLVPASLLGVIVHTTHNHALCEMRQMQQLTHETIARSAPCSKKARKKKKAGPVTYASCDPSAPVWENAGREFYLNFTWKECLVLCWW